MNIKKIFVLLFMFFACLLLPNKVEATNISYCYYSGYSLVLPVTIGVESKSIDRMYPFELNKILYDYDEIFVYDRNTCSQTLNVPSYDPNRYWTQNEYYYKYNEEITYVGYIGGGNYHKRDLTQPSIYTTVDTFVVTVDEEYNFENVAAFVSAYDETDGTIIPELTYENYSENRNKLGEYRAVYTACDNSNNCNSITIKIKVVDDIAPTINGPTNINSYMSKPLSNTDMITTLKAMDNYDGDISYKIDLISTNYNINFPGDYYAYFTVSDSSNNEVKIPYKLAITLIDDIVPTIEGPTLFESKLSSVISIGFITSNMIIYDNIDSEAYKNLYIISDTYTNNIYKIGTYSIIFGVYDKFGNESIPYKVEVNVIDDVIPTIDGKNSYTSYLSAPLTITTIKSNLVAYDNYDGNLYNKIEILDDTYSHNKNNIGIFHIFFPIKDSSNNISEPYKVEIVTYDDIAPNILGETSYKTLVSKKIDILSLKLSLIANDNIDGDISNQIVLNEDTYSTNFANPGNYFLTFYVVDKSGNISPYFKIKIIVNEDFSFLQRLNNSSIYLDTSFLRTQEEIYDILNLNSIDYNSIIVVEDTYTNNYNKIGNYTMTLEVENTDYTKEIVSININTYQNKKEETKEIKNDSKTKKETIFSKIISFINNIFCSIGAFFKNLFR